MFAELQDKNVVVVGASGFIGTHVCNILRKTAWLTLLDSESWNMLQPPPLHIQRLFEQTDLVINLSGWNGNIGFNAKHPATIFYENTVMGLNLLETCAAVDVQKVMSVVASCAYPNLDDPDPMRELGLMYEDEFLKFAPHESVACHGYAKRNLQIASRFYKDEHGLNAVCGCLTTCYGPGDSFDTERTKVLGSLIAKFVDAADSNQPEVVLWGDGSPLREFIYVKDAARDLIRAAIHYENSTEPINVGNGTEISIKDLAALVAKEAGFAGTIKWDGSKPNGQMRKKLDYSKFNDMFHDTHLPYTSLAEGIKETVAYYRETRNA